MLENTKSKAVSLKHSCQPNSSLALLKGSGDGRFVIRGNVFFILLHTQSGIQSPDNRGMSEEPAGGTGGGAGCETLTHRSSRGSRSRSCLQSRCHSSVPRRWLCTDTGPPAYCSWHSATLGDCTYMLARGEKIKTDLVVKEFYCSHQLAGFAL